MLARTANARQKRTAMIPNSTTPIQHRFPARNKSEDSFQFSFPSQSTLLHFVYCIVGVSCFRCFVSGYIHELSQHPPTTSQQPQRGEHFSSEVRSLSVHRVHVPLRERQLLFCAHDVKSFEVFHPGCCTPNTIKRIADTKKPRKSRQELPIRIRLRKRFAFRSFWILLACFVICKLRCTSRVSSPLSIPNVSFGNGICSSFYLSITILLYYYTEDKNKSTRQENTECQKTNITTYQSCKLRSERDSWRNKGRKYHWRECSSHTVTGDYHFIICYYNWEGYIW